jgi:carbamoyl-phosphate synthase large subunit
VLDILDMEKPEGVVVSMGGQIPNNLAIRLDKENIKILGTSAVSIDKAEDRHKFSSLLDELNIDQPEWKELTTFEEVNQFIDKVGYPVIVRPSYVLSGAAMNIVSNQHELKHFLTIAAKVSKRHPVVVSKFIEGAKEIEIDAVARNGDVLVYAMSEHIEFAGVHSGDATIVFPPQKIYFETVRRIKKITRSIAKSLNITGPFNIQFLAKDNDIKVIECNLRASRSFPFVSKVLKSNLIEMATKTMLGLEVVKPDKSIFDLDYIGIKAPQFSFFRLQEADPVVSVDMSSTGEVGCLGEDYYEALLLAMLSVGYTIPEKNILLSTGPPKSKIELITPARLLVERGFKLYATKGSQEFFADNGVEAEILHWPDELKEPNVLDFLKQRKIDLVINIPKNLSREELNNDFVIRRTSIDFNIPLITDARLAGAFLTAIANIDINEINIKHWNEY